MFDPLTISSALSSTKTIYDLLKGASDTHLAMKVSSEVANIQGKLIDVQQQTLTIQQENQELRSRGDEDIRLLGMAFAVRHNGAGRLVDYEISSREAIN